MTSPRGFLLRATDLPMSAPEPTAHDPIPLQPSYTQREYTYRTVGFSADLTVELRPGQVPRISFRVIPGTEADQLHANKDTGTQITVHPFILIERMPMAEFLELATLIPGHSALQALLDTLNPQDLPLYGNAPAPT